MKENLARLYTPFEKNGAEQRQQHQQQHNYGHRPLDDRSFFVRQRNSPPFRQHSCILTERRGK